MEIVRTVVELRRIVRRWHQKGLTVGLVLTMGSLHEGHLSLIDQSVMRADRTIATIFINPTQFAAHEDLSTYPQNESHDSDLLISRGTDLLFTPNRDEMYPDGHMTRIEVSNISTILEGVTRPHFFGGVATIVTKLFMQSQADIAVFGEKDYQQLCVIKQLAKDLNIPIEILSGPTLREPDGLAMSSRNVYLTPEQRKQAPLFHQALTQVADDFRSGIAPENCLQKAQETLLSSGYSNVDYIDIRDSDTLERITNSSKPARILGTVTLGKTRLIDNIQYHFAKT